MGRVRTAWVAVAGAVTLAGCAGAPTGEQAASGSVVGQSEARRVRTQGVPGESSAGGRARAGSSAAASVGVPVVSAGQVEVIGGASMVERRPWVAALPAAVRQVRAVWGDDLREPVTLRVPADATEYAAVAGGPPSGAAVAVFGSGGTVVVVAPGPARNDAVRVALLTHELAHAAQRRSGTHGTGSWVLEGSAMWTQLRGADLRTHADTRLLREAARAGSLPGTLPLPTAFTGGEASRIAYEQAWTLCRYLEERFGPGTVAGLARDVAAGETPEAALLARTSLTPGALESGWAAWVRGWS